MGMMTWLMLWAELAVKRREAKSKVVSEEALQKAVKMREWKAKEKRKDISIWMQSSKE